jgi:putative ABC transport system permease protein
MFENLNRNTRPVLDFSRLADDLRQDLRYAARQLRRAPGFAALVIATLAIGIGANATMVGVIDRLVLQPPAGVSEPSRLTRLLIRYFNSDGTGGVSSIVNYPTYVDFVNNTPALTSVAGYTKARSLPLVSNDPSAEAMASMVTANFFSTLGVQPAAGRFFATSDGFPTAAQSGGPALAVLSYAFWQREFGGASTVINSTVQVGKVLYTVVGVAPSGFNGIEQGSVDVWLPITVAFETVNTRSFLSVRDGGFLSMIGRLVNDDARKAAEVQGTAVYRAIDALERTKTDKRPLPSVLTASIIPGRGPDAPREVKTTLWLGGVSSLVLLLVSANVANLLLGRAFSRRREIAVRLALGAGRGRLARQLLVESLTLSILGGAVGVYLAALGSRALQSLILTNQTSATLIGPRLLFFTVSVTIATGIIVSLVPMLFSTAPDLSNGLRASSNNASTRGLSVRSVLLATQAAMCLVLLVGAALFAQSLRRVQSLDLGVDLDRTLRISMVGLADIGMPAEQRWTVVNEIKRKVNAIPGVRRSAFSSDVFGGGRATPIHNVDRTFDEVFPPGSWNEAAYESAVDSGLFSTIGTTSLHGRDFNSEDRAGGHRVVILNAPLAKRLFPNSDPLGKCVVMPVYGRKESEGECVIVVGVLNGFYRRSIIDRGQMAAYIPLAQQTLVEAPLLLYAQTSGNADAVSTAVREAVLSVRPDLRRLSVGSMRASIEPQMRPWNLAALMFGLFGVVALVIAAIGLYAVVSFAVTQRTNEIAVRLALGARVHHIGLTVGNESLRAVVAGLAVGVMVAYIAQKWIGGMLYQTSPSDPAVIGAVAVSLMLVTVVALVVPLQRALRVSPAQVLREV